MKYLPLIAVAMLSLTGCIEIDQVSQPSEGRTNQAFNVQLDVSSSEGTCLFSDCLAEIAITIPESWEISNCSFVAGNSAEPQVCNITASSQNDLINLLPIAPGYKRPALNSIINTTGNQVSTGIMNFTITPRSAGDFSITYTGSAHAYFPGSDTKSWFPGGISENNLIAIAPAQVPIPSAVPVPTIGVFGLGALSVLVIFVARGRRFFSQNAKSSHPV